MGEPVTGGRYAHPLTERYSSAEMQSIFSPARRYACWRRLWLARAEAQRELGLEISEEALSQMRVAGERPIDLTRADEYEQRFRHDVMAHVHLFGDDAPAAQAILHLGATSAFIVDNADIILQREALLLVRARLVRCVSAVSYTHLTLPTKA